MLHKVECHSILRHLKYLWWCVTDAWDTYWDPPCPECGLKKKK